MTIITNFLNLFYIPSLHDIPPQHKPRATPTPYPPTQERLKLESVAMNILAYKHTTTPGYKAGEKVQYMSEKELTEIIEQFRNDIL